MGRLCCVSCCFPLAFLPHGALHHLPGGEAGEGCSAEGGCASCPYMKMNSLAALRSVCRRIGSPSGEALLQGNRPRAYTDTVGGRSMAQVQLHACSDITAQCAPRSGC